MTNFSPENMTFWQAFSSILCSLSGSHRLELPSLRRSRQAAVFFDPVIGQSGPSLALGLIFGSLSLPFPLPALVITILQSRMSDNSYSTQACHDVGDVE